MAIDAVLGDLEAPAKRQRHGDDILTYTQALRTACATAAGDLCAAVARATGNPALAVASTEPTTEDERAALAGLGDPRWAPRLVAAVGRLLAETPVPALRPLARPLPRAGPRGLRAAWLALHRCGLPVPVVAAVWGSWLSPDDLAPPTASISMPLCDLMVGAAFAVRDEHCAHCGPAMDTTVGRWVLWCSGHTAALPPTPLHFGVTGAHRFASGGDAVPTVPVSSGLFTMSLSNTQMIGLIDVEGFTLCRGGSNRHKATTLVPFAVAALLVRGGAVVRSGTWLVSPRGFDPAQDGVTVSTALARCKNRGLFQRAEERGRLDVDRVVREVRDFLGNGELPVYARGTAIEVRFLSGVGLCGEVALSRAAAAECPFPVIDLAEVRDQAGVPICPPFGGAVHDPLEELRFFAPFASDAHDRRA